MLTPKIRMLCFVIINTICFSLSLCEKGEPKRNRTEVLLLTARPDRLAIGFRDVLKLLTAKRFFCLNKSKARNRLTKKEKKKGAFESDNTKHAHIFCENAIFKQRAARYYKRW